MIEFYADIKLAHIVLVIASGALFTLRGIGVQLGARWPLAWPLRWTSYALDTALLTAALMLLTILPREVFANGWLTAKLIGVVTYVVLGSFALRRARSPKARAAFFLAALATLLFVFSIARSHHPLGALSWV